MVIELSMWSSIASEKQSRCRFVLRFNKPGPRYRKFSDVLDPTIKYGGGQVKIQNILSDYSDLVANHEALETSYTIFPIRFGEDLVKRREIIHEGLRGVIENVTKIIGAINDISN